MKHRVVLLFVLLSMLFMFQGVYADPIVYELAYTGEDQNLLDKLESQEGLQFSSYESFEVNFWSKENSPYRSSNNN